MTDVICEQEIIKNIIAVDTGQALTRSLKELNCNCKFKEHWDNFCKSYYGDDDRKAYSQKPEVKAKIKAYNKAYYQKPEVKAKIKAYSQKPEVKAKARMFMRKKLHIPKARWRVA